MSRWWARDPCESLVVNLPSQRRSGRRGQLRRYNVMVVSDVWPSKTTRFARKAAKRAETAAESDETKECFWRQRARRFHVDAHFPALVSQQLLPGWHAISPEDEDEYDTRQQPPAGYFGFSQTLFKTTASCNAKFQKKDVAEEEKIRLPWMAIGNAGSADLCGRGPVLHLGDTYRDEPVKARQSDESLIVVKEPLLPVGRASTVQRSSYTDLAGSGCSLANSESRHHEIQERKLRGEASRKELERRYASRRKDFRRRRDMASTTVSGWRTLGSSFRPPRQTSFNPQISTGSVGPATGNLLKDLKDLKDLSLDMNFKQ